MRIRIQKPVKFPDMFLGFKSFLVLSPFSLGWISLGFSIYPRLRLFLGTFFSFFACAYKDAPSFSANFLVFEGFLVFSSHPLRLLYIVRVNHFSNAKIFSCVQVWVFLSTCEQDRANISRHFSIFEGFLIFWCSAYRLGISGAIMKANSYGGEGKKCVGVK